MADWPHQRLPAPCRALPRFATIAAPTAAIALVAVFFVLSTGGDRASASTLTAFEDAIERQQDGVWLTLEDDAHLNEGDASAPPLTARCS